MPVNRCSVILPSASHHINQPLPREREMVIELFTRESNLPIILQMQHCRASATHNTRQHATTRESSVYCHSDQPIISRSLTGREDQECSSEQLLYCPRDRMSSQPALLCSYSYSGGLELHKASCQSRELLLFINQLFNNINFIVVSRRKNMLPIYLMKQQFIYDSFLK